MMQVQVPASPRYAWCFSYPARILSTSSLRRTMHHQHILPTSSGSHPSQQHPIQSTLCIRCQDLFGMGDEVRRLFLSTQYFAACIYFPTLDLILYPVNGVHTRS